MTKNTINRPTNQPRAPKPQAEPQPTTQSSINKNRKIADKKADAKAKSARPQAPRPHRPPRMGGGHGAGAAGAHGAAEHHDEDAGAGGAGAIGAAEAGDELHRRRSGHEQVHVEEKEEHKLEEQHDTAATGADAVKRSKGGDTGGGDGFEGGRDQKREAYERYMKGNVSADKERFDELRRKGTKDDFKPDLQPAEVEALGTTRATAHVVRLYDTWTLAGMNREEAVSKAASLLAGFQSTTNIRKVLAELESKPIRDVYPLEVLMKILDERPELLPGVRSGSVLGNVAELSEGKKILAGYPATLTVPTDVRLKSFALLGGSRPGYEFQPHKDEGKYTLLVDTPGRYKFALLAAPLQSLGRIQRETAEAIVEIFECAVYAMDKKGEPLSPEDWLQQQQLEEDDGDADDADGTAGDASADADAEKPREVEIAPNLPSQIRRALELISRDEVSGAGSGVSATTYSWDASFYKPGAPVDGEPILHLVVNKAGPFDQAWVKAREALAQKQKEYEPGRAVVTQEDFTAALRRARMR